MDKKNIENLRKKLEKEKILIEEQLKNFAQKDKKNKDDWDTKYPEFNEGGFSSQQLEEEADEVEEYLNLLPIEHNLELKLKKINSAIERIENNTFGKCLKCGGKINEKKLKLYPETEYCNKCQNKI